MSHKRGAERGEVGTHTDATGAERRRTRLAQQPQNCSRRPLLVIDPTHRRVWMQHQHRRYVFLSEITRRSQRALRISMDSLRSHPGPPSKMCAVKSFRGLHSVQSYPGALAATVASSHSSLRLWCVTQVTTVPGLPSRFGGREEWRE